MANRTIADIVATIRTAVFGKDVRDGIADGIEICYTDVTNGVTLANTAASNANSKATLANSAATAANQAAATALSYANVEKIGSTNDYKLLLKTS